MRKVILFSALFMAHSSQAINLNCLKLLWFRNELYQNAWLVRVDQGDFGEGYDRLNDEAKQVTDPAIIALYLNQHAIIDHKDRLLKEHQEKQRLHDNDEQKRAHMYPQTPPKRACGGKRK